MRWLWRRWRERTARCLICAHAQYMHVFDRKGRFKHCAGDDFDDCKCPGFVERGDGR